MKRKFYILCVLVSGMVHCVHSMELFNLDTSVSLSEYVRIATDSVPIANQLETEETPSVSLPAYELVIPKIISVLVNEHWKCKRFKKACGWLEKMNVHAHALETRHAKQELLAWKGSNYTTDFQPEDIKTLEDILGFDIQSATKEVLKVLEDLKFTSDMERIINNRLNTFLLTEDKKEDEYNAIALYVRTNELLKKNTITVMYQNLKEILTHTSCNTHLGKLVLNFIKVIELISNESEKCDESKERIDFTDECISVRDITNDMKHQSIA